MKALLSNLSKFISVSLELYSPLPFEFTSDLHTLNAYLRTYSAKEQKLLESFVTRLSQKLSAKLQPSPHSQTANFDEALRHYNSCSIKFPELKLQIPSQNNQKSFVQERKVHSYRSSGRSKPEDGIKPSRHKFGTRKQLTAVDEQTNKENSSIFANSKNSKQNYLENSGDDRSLKFIKSQAGLAPYDCSIPRNVSTEAREQKKAKTKPRHESNDNKANAIPLQLKIRIRAKPNSELQPTSELQHTFGPQHTFELPKLIQNICQIQKVMRQSEQDLNNLLAQINFSAQIWIQGENYEY